MDDDCAGDLIEAARAVLRPHGVAIVCSPACLGVVPAGSLIGLVISVRP